MLSSGKAAVKAKDKLMFLTGALTENVSGYDAVVDAATEFRESLTGEDGLIEHGGEASGAQIPDACQDPGTTIRKAGWIPRFQDAGCHKRRPCAVIVIR